LPNYDTPSELSGETLMRRADFNKFQWKSYYRGLYQLPVATQATICHTHGANPDFPIIVNDTTQAATRREAAGSWASLANNQQISR
jgi:hypothetical protein